MAKGWAMRYGHATVGISGAIGGDKPARPRKKQNIYQPHLSDEEAKDVIRKKMLGVSYAQLAEDTGFSESSIRSLCQGVNRGHLLMQVEREPKRMIG